MASERQDLAKTGDFLIPTLTVERRSKQAMHERSSISVAQQSSQFPHLSIPRTFDELSSMFDDAIIFAALTSLGMSLSDVTLDTAQDATISVKESKIQADRRAAAVKKLAIKCIDLSEVPEEVTRWISVRAAPPETMRRDTSTQFQRRRPQSAPSGRGWSDQAARNAAARQKFLQASDHKVMTMLDSMLVEKRNSDVGEEKRAASEARFKKFRADQQAYFDARAKQNKAGEEKVQRRVDTQIAEQEEARADYGRSHDENMARVEANRERLKAELQEARQREHKTVDLKIEQEIKRRRSQARAMAADIQRKTAAVEEYREQTRQYMNERRKQAQSKYLSRVQNAQDYNENATREREEQYFKSRAKYDGVRAAHDELLRSRSDGYRTSNRQRRDLYEKGKARNAAERGHQMDNLLTKQQRASENARYIRDLGLKSGITLEDHTQERELWTGVTKDNIRRLDRAQSARRERCLRVVEERMALASANKAELRDMANERARLAMQFEKLKTESNKVFQRLKGVKDPQRLATEVEKLGFKVDLAAYGFDQKGSPKPEGSPKESPRG